MIKAVCEDLRGEVVCHKSGDALALIISESLEEGFIADLVPYDEILRENCLTGELTVTSGDDDHLAPLVVLVEAFEIGCLVGEIEFRLRGVFQFNDEALDVESSQT